jgi:hypothetical protein
LPANRGGGRWPRHMWKCHHTPLCPEVNNIKTRIKQELQIKQIKCMHAQKKIIIKLNWDKEKKLKVTITETNLKQSNMWEHTVPRNNYRRFIIKKWHKCLKTYQKQ